MDTKNIIFLKITGEPKKELNSLKLIEKIPIETLNLLTN